MRMESATQGPAGNYDPPEPGEGARPPPIPICPAGSPPGATEASLEGRQAAQPSSSSGASSAAEAGSGAPDARAGIEESVPEVDLLSERKNAEELATKMERYLDAFYSGEITAGMLAANPALQLWVQQALQWENRFITTMSNLLREMHETRKVVLNNLRG